MALLVMATAYKMNYKPPSFNFLIPNVLKIPPVLALDKMRRDITSLKGICQKLTTIWVSQSHRAVQTKTGPSAQLDYINQVG